MRLFYSIEFPGIRHHYNFLSHAAILKYNIVGYSKLKNCIRLLFWSGQSFDEPGLHPEGTFKAAEIRYTSADQINAKDLKRWLIKSKKIQWDYKNIVKRKRVLEKLM